jgi:hypothetical protein
MIAIVDVTNMRQSNGVHDFKVRDKRLEMLQAILVHLGLTVTTQWGSAFMCEEERT